MAEDYIIRIVRLTFSERTIDDFEALYSKHEKAISSQPGCYSIDLVTDASNPFVKSTISKWKDEESLNNYRNSELFGVVWPETKALFTEKPEVWSYKAKK